MHIVVPIRPLQEDGASGTKQKKVPVLAPDGQPVLNQKGQPYSGSAYNGLEQERNFGRIREVPGRGCAMNYCEEKDLQKESMPVFMRNGGLDQFPMVHEGPSIVPAMEARGISTALGSF